jgi:hypothetical protein
VRLHGKKLQNATKAELRKVVVVSPLIHVSLLFLPKTLTFAMLFVIVTRDRSLNQRRAVIFHDGLLR